MRILQIFSKQNISQFRTCVEKTLSQGLLMAHMLQQGHGTWYFSLPKVKEDHLNVTVHALITLQKSVNM